MKKQFNPNYFGAFELEKKYNENHDERGRFTSGDGSSSIGDIGGGKGGVTAHMVTRLEAYNAEDFNKKTRDPQSAAASKAGIAAADQSYALIKAGGGSKEQHHSAAAANRSAEVMHRAAAENMKSAGNNQGVNAHLRAAAHHAVIAQGHERVAAKKK